MHFLRGFKIERHLIEFLFILACVSLVLFTQLSSESFAEVEYWAVEAGDKTIAVTSTKSDAEKAVEEIESYYTRDDAVDVSVTVDPAITVEQKQYEKDEAPSIMSTEEAVDTVIRDLESKDPSLKITTTQSITKTKTIKQKSLVKKTSNLIEDAIKVDKGGYDGEKLLTVEITTINGEKQESEVTDSEVVKAPKNEVIYKGTRKDDEEDSKDNEGSAGQAFHVKHAKNGKTFVADLTGKEMGQKVADYGLNFMGNPYVYGGSSLTKGADCSGFVMAVYKHFGISLPHDAHAQRKYGVEVKLKDARPGDLICFQGHIGIYIGDSKIVHAMNVANGITTSKLGYNGKSIVTIRRLFA